MKETIQKLFQRRPSVSQVVTCLLLVALCVSNITMRGEMKALRAEMEGCISSTDALEQDIMSVTDAIDVLERAAVMNVANGADLFALLRERRECEKKGVTPVDFFYEEVEPTACPWKLFRSVDELGYKVFPCSVCPLDGGGTVTHYGEALQPNAEGWHDLSGADECCITVDLDELTKDPYGISESDIYVIYDDGFYGNIRIMIHNKTDDVGYRMDIPFKTASNDLGLKFKKFVPVECLRNGNVELTFSISDREDGAPEVFTLRAIGVNMIGNIMVYPESAYKKYLPA